MEIPELSLATIHDSVVNKSTNSSSSDSESNPSRKRKFFSDHGLLKTEKSIHTSVDLQLKDPLPLDWEQCLDLESGRMYYLNRKTLRKSCNWPKDQKLDLELHIATHSNNSCSEQYISSADALGDSKKRCSPSSNMMALPCLNCHLLVILSKSFPSCPNCKYVHLFPSQQSPPSRAPVVKSLNTLSLLN
ncbi:uncharacterized protein LOC121245781 [Juglans microcarpa x Juglans regia]|uniref:uncharacterized protein LOC121245781 n=1 Tax=Juglans microcarpa x Juglans regia TaxID=2249226 RepID=UPI001B7DD84D|nr:uncharacterized protein LOC121245781 [Juglans microcarpa x Juglans regia]